MPQEVFVPPFNIHVKHFGLSIIAVNPMLESVSKAGLVVSYQIWLEQDEKCDQ